MSASTVGRVIESRNPKISVGELVSGMLSWQEQAGQRWPARPTGRTFAHPGGCPPELMLSTLGATGLTAYFGMCDVGQVKQGDAVLVSGAASATGSVAAQIAKFRGAARVVGIAGGPLKCKWLLEEAGLDGAIYYKSEDLLARLREEFPKEIDLFFDNVGGTVLNDSLLRMAWFGRVILCGGISSYDDEVLPPGPSNYM